MCFLSTFSWIINEQMSNRIDLWTSSWENLSSGVCDQVRLKPKLCVMTSKRQSFENVYRIKQLLTFISVNMKCYWTVNSSYWPPLRVSQYEVNTSWPPQQKSIVLQYWKPKINSFSYAEKINYGVCARTFGSTLTMANFPAGWPLLSAKIH